MWLFGSVGLINDVLSTGVVIVGCEGTNWWFDFKIIALAFT
jgi:hypothetical protein